jgi:stearoyl-CoA desaturase (delta-9 desaturase)
MATRSNALAPLPRRGLTWRTIDWPVTIAFVILHLGVLAAPFFFSWSGLIVAFGLAWLTGMWGVTIGYHRLLTHRSFRTPKWFEYLVATFGTLSLQGGPIQWVGTHRIHHKHSDEETDPHTPRHGFTWAHILWCLKTTGEDGSPGASAARDLERDPVLRMLNLLHWLPSVLVAVALYFAGEWYGGLGWSWVVWGVAVRTVFVFHVTWFVNSAAHTWGYRNFETTDGSTNNWWVALLSFGEGWHNNHHADQRSARHGMRWFELDLTYWMIRALSLVGLARDIKRPQVSTKG